MTHFVDISYRFILPDSHIEGAADALKIHGLIGEVNEIIRAAGFTPPLDVAEGVVEASQSPLARTVEPKVRKPRAARQAIATDQATNGAAAVE